MLVLRLLGETTLLDSSGEPLESVLGQTKAFALLAYLAARPGEFVSRDVLRGLLWPESDAKRAGTSLRVALHGLRSELGKKAVQTRSDHAVAVDPQAMDSDVARLRRALDDRDWQEALALHRGPFLHGFYVDRCREYMSWAHRTAATLEREVISLVLSEGEDLLEAARAEPAAEAGAGALRIRPLEERAIRLRIRALAAAARRGQAVREGEAFVAAFREALELPPSGETVEEIRRIQEAPAETPQTPAGAGAEASDDGAEESTTAMPAAEAAEGSVDAEARGPRSLRTGRQWALAAGGLVIVVAAAWALFGRSASAPGESHVPAPEVAAMVREGRTLLAEGRTEEAAEAFRSATEADSLYGEAFYRLSTAAALAGWQDVSDAALERAVELAESLPPRIRRLARAKAEPLEARGIYLAMLEEDARDAEVLLQLGELEFHWGSVIGVPAADSRHEFETLLQVVPGHREALSHLLRLAAMRGDLEEVVRIRRSLEAGAHSALDVTLAQALHAVLDPRIEPPIPTLEDLGEGELRQVNEAVAAVAVAPEGVGSFFEALARADLSERSRAEVYLWNAISATARGRPRKAGLWLDRLGEIVPARREEFLAHFSLLPYLPFAPDAAGAARARLRAHTGDDPIGPDAYDLHRDAVYAHRRVFLEYLTELPGPDTGTSYPAFDAQPQQTVVDVGAYERFRRILGARAVYHVTGDPEPAMDALGERRWVADRVRPGLLSYPIAYERTLRASLLADLGRRPEALQWLSTFPDPSGYDRAFLPGVLVSRGQIELREGDREAAARSFRLAVRYLQDAEGPFRELLRNARNGLGRAEG